MTIRRFKPEVGKRCPFKFNQPRLSMLCIEEDCAWWIHSDGACAIEVIGGVLFAMANDILAEKAALAKHRNK